MLAALFLLSATQVIEVSDLTFLDDTGASIPLATGIVPAEKPGRITGTVSINSNQTDGSGAYVPPRLNALWRIPGTASLLRQDTDWYGGDAFDPLVVTAFDPSTGAATLLFEITLGTRGAQRCPRLAEGAATIDFVLGWEQSLGRDSNGEPVGFDWEGNLSYEASWPNCWIDLELRSASLNDDFLALLSIRDVSSLAIVFSLTPSLGGVLTLPNTVTIPAGQKEVEFQIQTNGHRARGVEIQASDGGQLVADSPSLRISAGVIIATAASLDSGGEDPPIIDPPLQVEWETDRVCVPPTYNPSPSTMYDCTRCSYVASPPCLSTVIPINSVDCDYDLFNSCLKGPSHTSTLSGPAYALSDSFTETCWFGKSKSCCIFTKLPETGTGVAPSCL